MSKEKVRLFIFHISSTHTHTHTHTHPIHALTCTLALSLSHTHTHIHMHSLSCTHTHTYTHTHTHTHTHTQLPLAVTAAAFTTLQIFTEDSISIYHFFVPLPGLTISCKCSLEHSLCCTPQTMMKTLSLHNWGRQLKPVFTLLLMVNTPPGALSTINTPRPTQQPENRQERNNHQAVKKFQVQR